MRFVYGLVLISLVSCVHAGKARYEAEIEPRVDSAKKMEMAKLLGEPIKCETIQEQERCEYRSALGRNEPVPDAYRRNDAMGPDVSPYEFFDVIHLYYDSLGVLRSWKPIVVR